MIIVCAECQARYQVDEAKFGGRKVKCPKCAAVFAVPSAAPAAAFSPKDTTKVINLQEMAEQTKPLPPSDRRFSVVVLSGPMSGQVIPVTKSVFVVGRATGDLVLPDTEVSRRHCQIEILEDGRILLRDLESTNGTFYRSERITEIPLEDKTEFTAGKTALMFLITAEE
jgi:predicted Zn finger-like uncharacterized protein